MTTKITNETPSSFPDQLINEPTQLANPGKHITQLGPLQHLLGTWTNQQYDKETGAPYSYNLMPLPQAVNTGQGVTGSRPTGYILKNFKYYEEITFSAISGAAPNRGGDYTQTANVIFYEQRVYFAEGPDKDQLVHAENGSWLYLDTGPQPEGAYSQGPDVPFDGPIPPQPTNMQIAKQISVPHGNSILALGTVDNIQGALSIPDYGDGVYPNGAFPKGQVNTSQYGIATDVAGGNPYPELNNNPNQPLIDGTQTACNNYIKLDVSTNPNNGGSVTNIPFEQEKANVVDYNATYWLESFGSSKDFTQLAYSQTIVMKIPINGQIVEFPHVTGNVLTKKS